MTIICKHPTHKGYDTLSAPTTQNILYFGSEELNHLVQYEPITLPIKKHYAYVKAVVKIDNKYVAFDCSHGVDESGRPLFRYEENEDFFESHKECLSSLGSLTESVVRDFSFEIVEEPKRVEPYRQLGSYACGSKHYAEQEGFATHNNTTHHCIEINGAIETVTLKMWDGSTMVIGLCSNISGTKTTSGVRYCDIKTTLKGEVTLDGKIVKLNGKVQV